MLRCRCAQLLKGRVHEDVKGKGNEREGRRHRRETGLDRVVLHNGPVIVHGADAVVRLSDGGCRRQRRRVVDFVLSDVVDHVEALVQDGSVGKLAVRNERRKVDAAVLSKLIPQLLSV
jgi:hypothetical protein